MTSLLKYFFYYIAINLLVSVFIVSSIKLMVLNLCTVLVGISFLAALVGLFWESSILRRIEDVCLKMPFVFVGVIILTKIALGS